MKVKDYSLTGEENMAAMMDALREFNGS